MHQIRMEMRFDNPLKHFLLSFCFFMAMTAAGSSLAGTDLTWEDCVRESSIRNPDLRSSGSTLQSSEFKVKGAHSGYWPQLNGNLNYSFSNNGSSAVSGGGGSPIFVTTGTGNHSTSSATLSATQNLFAGFQDQSKVRQAIANKDVARESLNTVRAQVSFDLKSAFANLLYAQNSLKLTQDIIRRREANLHMIELRYENGNENKGSLLLSKAYLDQAKYDELQARDAVRAAQVALAKALGRDDAGNIRITGDIPTSPPPELKDLKALALQTPDYRQSVAQKKAAKEALTQARSPFFPNLNLVGSVGKQGTGTFPQDDARWSVGGNLSWALFNGGKDYFASKSATADLEAASFNEESIGRQAADKLQQAWNAFVESIQKLKADQSFLEAAGVREEIGINRYNNGLLSFEDWDIIENDLISRQKQVLQSRKDRVISEAAWERALGKGVFQ